MAISDLDRIARTPARPAAHLRPTGVWPRRSGPVARSPTAAAAGSAQGDRPHRCASPPVRAGRPRRPAPRRREDGTRWSRLSRRRPGRRSAASGSVRALRRSPHSPQALRAQGGRASGCTEARRIPVRNPNRRNSRPIDRMQSRARFPISILKPTIVLDISSASASSPLLSEVAPFFAHRNAWFVALRAPAGKAGRKGVGRASPTLGCPRHRTAGCEIRDAGQRGPARRCRSGMGRDR